LGYKKKRYGGFSIVESEAQIIRELFNDFLKGYGLKKLSVRFEMYPSVVKKRLTCRTYTGALGYKKDWKEGRHEAIISKEQFEEVQRKLKK
jgi:hypothetical protein